MHLTLTRRLGREGLSTLEGKGVLENQMKMNWLDVIQQNFPLLVRASKVWRMWVLSSSMAPWPLVG